jgi:hypothetical protein
VTFLLVIIQLFSPGRANPVTSPDTVISCNYQNVPFAVFCIDLSQKTGIPVYYRADWINGITVNLEVDSITVSSALEKALERKELQVSEWHGNLVVLPGEKLPRSLPVFTDKQVITKPDEEAAASLTQSEERYLIGRQADVTQTVEVGSINAAGTNGKVTILGRITDQQTGEPGLEKITTKTIKEIPMLMGERDIIRVSEMLPGIVTVGEGSAGYP